jgi:hypothetical protein
LAILGRGSAAAYYLNTVDRSRYPKIVVIGEDDPWAGRRGGNPSNPSDPVNIVNQSLSMIGHFGGTAPKTSSQLVPRAEWARMNKQIIDQCRVDTITGTILKVRKTKAAYLNQRDQAVMGKAEFCYAIEVKRKNFAETYYALKVVVATGAGEHKPPDDRFLPLARKHPTLFIDMDTFARHPEMRTKGKTIIVQGPNAAVDSVDTAAYNECRVFWLTGTPAILATPHQVGARAVAAHVSTGPTDPGVVALDRTKGVVDPVTIRVDNGAVKVKVKKFPGEITADHYVWGIGQDSTGAVNFIDPTLLNALEPIYDRNQRFGDTYQSVLGFQLEGTTSQEGFEVVGALARQVLLARGEIKHTYLRDLERVVKGMQGQLNLWAGELNTYGYEFLLEPLENLGKIPPKNLVRTIGIVRGLMATISPTWINIAKALCATILNWVIAKQFLDQVGGKVRDEDLNNALKILTPSTVGSPQLGSIRTVTQAMNGFMPVYVSRPGGGDLNWSHDDQTVLRVFIAVNYPCVPEEDCQRIIRKMIQGRRHQDPKKLNEEVTPGNWGYTDLQINQFKDELKLINERWAMTFTMPKTVGTGQTTL